MTNEQLTQFKRLHSVLHTAELSGDTDNTSARSVLSRTLHCCLLRYYTHSLRKPAQPCMAMLPLSCGLAGVNRSAMSPLLLAQTVSRNARAGTRKAARIFSFRFIGSRPFCISRLTRLLNIAFSYGLIKQISMSFAISRNLIINTY